MVPVRTGEQFSASLPIFRAHAESDGLNNRGEIAFGAVFTDGSNGVFVSSIGAVPEPSTGLLAAAGISVLLLMRRWRNSHPEKSLVCRRVSSARECAECHKEGRDEFPEQFCCVIKGVGFRLVSG